LLRRTPVERFFDTLAVRLNGPDAADEDYRVIIEFTDLGQSYRLEIENAVLHHRPADPGDEADARLMLTHEMFVAMLTGKAGLREMLTSDELEVEGSVLDLVGFFSLFDKPEGRFNIVEP